MTGQQQSVRTAQSVLLDMLGQFDRVCEEHGLRYIASHGTLLGAVRDGGFAPGDDDLDVAMPRADYDRLLEVARTGAFGWPYFLQTPENDPECFFGGFAKLRDSSTSAINPHYAKRAYNQGIWMDILPLDNCPSDDKDVQRQQRIVRFWQRILYAKTYGFDPLKFWDANPSHVSAYFILEKRLSRETACRQLRKACMSAKPTGQLTVFARHYQRVPNSLRYDLSDIEDARRVTFEGTTIPVPAHAESWLARQYGSDWHIARADDDGESGHDALIDPNTPYRELLSKDDEVSETD